MTFANTLPARPPWRLKPLPPLHLYFVLFVAGIFSFLLGHVWSAGPVGALFSLLSAGTCGLSWLLARALFRPGPQPIWPRVVVAVLFATAIGSDLLSGAAAELRQVVHNVAGLVSSTVLLLCLVEAIDGLGAADGNEKRFRLMFAAGYTALAFTSVILLRQSDIDTATATLIKEVCAVLAVAGATAAVWYRARHPLAAPETVRRRRIAAIPDAALGQKIKRLLEADQIYVRPDIKLADLARLTGEPDYKVTQCITGALGFANFNRLINSYRIERAKRQLADSALIDRPILTIALECGFGSIGPFNRAFKDAVGMTPSQYRQALTA